MSSFIVLCDGQEKRNWSKDVFQYVTPFTRSRALTCDLSSILVSQDKDFEEMIALAEILESQYGHLFDKVIVNGDIAVAFRELKADLEKVAEAGVQWVPAEWICSTPTKAADIWLSELRSYIYVTCLIVCHSLQEDSTP